MTEAEKWAEYDSAKFALSIVVSHFSEIIFVERKGQNPDLVQIEKWRSEQTELSRLKQALTVDDMATIERVNTIYGPKAQALLKKE